MTDDVINVEAKPWYLSATLWFNILAGIVALLDWAVVQQFSFVQEPWFMFVVALVNFILRFKTDRPVALAKDRMKMVSRRV